MKKRLSGILLTLIFFIGLSLLLYPTLSDYWNSLHQSRAIAAYSGVVSDLEESSYEEIWDQAVMYNRQIAENGIHWKLTDGEKAAYNSQLQVDGTGIMGYIEIPKINCSLPIYHGTEDDVLQTAVGHMEGTSLPVGGESTHCVLSGHRGLPSAKLFSNLDQLEEGDVFVLRTMDEVLTYEVDQIRIVLPDDLTALQIEEGMDLCTLVTCTPYGINTHRLLVRGHRIANLAVGESYISADALQIEPVVAAPAVAVPILLLLLVWLLVSTRKKKTVRWFE